MWTLLPLPQPYCLSIVWVPQLLELLELLEAVVVVPYLAFPRETEEAFPPLELAVVLVFLQGEEEASQPSEPAVLAFLPGLAVVQAFLQQLEAVLVVAQQAEAASQASVLAPVLAFLRVRVGAFRPSVLPAVLAFLLAMASLP